MAHPTISQIGDTFGNMMGLSEKIGFVGIVGLEVSEESLKTRGY
jgi:hypothetical protein